MDNCRVHYIEEVEKKILDTAGVGRTSARKLTGNQILLPVSQTNPSLKTKDNVIKWAQNIINDIHQRFKAIEFGTMMSMDTDRFPGAVVLKYVIPSKLIDYYENNSGKGYKKEVKDIVESNPNNRDTLKKAEMVHVIPDDIREKYWADIRTSIDDSSFSPSQFEDFIEYLKNCK